MFTTLYHGLYRPLAGMFFLLAIYCCLRSSAASENNSPRLPWLGQLEKGMDLFRKAVELRPDYAEAHENLGRALAQQGKREEAVGHLEEAVRILKSHRAVGPSTN